MIIRWLSKITKYLFSSAAVVLYELRQVKQQHSKAHIVRASMDNIKDVLSFQSKIYIKIFVKFLNQGDAGYFAYVKDRCVHRAWVKGAPQKVKLHTFCSMKLKNDEVFIHYCETDPEFRGMNIYPHVLYEISKDFRNRSRIFISTDLANQSSIRGIQKINFEEVDRIRIVNILGIRILFSKNGRSLFKYAHP